MNVKKRTRHGLSPKRLTLHLSPSSLYLGLQPLISKVDAQLFEGVFLEMLEAENIKDGYCRMRLHARRRAPLH